MTDQIEGTLEQVQDGTVDVLTVLVTTLQELVQVQVLHFRLQMAATAPLAVSKESIDKLLTKHGLSKYLEANQ